MNEINDPVRKEKKALPHLPLLWVVAVALLSVGLCVLAALGFGGISGMALAAVGFAFLFATDKRYICYIAAPVSCALSFLVSGDILEALCVSLALPMALILYFCIASRKSLSVITVVMTVAVMASMALYMAYSVTNVYEKSVWESFLSFGREFKEMIVESFKSISYLGKDKELFAFSDDVVEAMTETVIMMLPAVLVIVCQLIAFGSAQLFYLLCRLFSCKEYFEKREWRITLSLPCAVIFMLSYILAAFCPSGTVPSYAAINLAYIIMPAAAVFGAFFMFGKGGFLRRSLPVSTKVIFIIACAFTVLMSPFSVFPLLAFIGSGAVIWRVIFEYIEKRRRENGED